jgi:threonine/homoserine/homoserine lactone efflux protein
VNLPFFFQGVVIGLSIAAPVGPVGILRIRRTLANGRFMGFLTGFGAATADAVYGSIAAFGLTIISMLLINFQNYLRLGGGIFLFFLGLRFFFTKPTNNNGQSGEATYFSAYVSAFFLTITNPLTILSFTGVFAGLCIVTNTDNETINAILMVIGVFVGSTLWWVLLSSASSILKNRLTPKGLLWVNRISGIIILGFGLAAFVSLVL